MMRRTALLGSSLLVTLAVGACGDQSTQPAAALPPARAALDLAADGETEALGPVAFAGAGEALDGQYYADLAADAINPSDYVCSTATPLRGWLNAAVQKSVSVEQNLFLTAYLTHRADLVPTFEAMFFGTTATPQYFGRDGQHTHAIGKAERELKRFWDVPTSDVQVVAMHGNVLLDTLRTIPTYRMIGQSPVQSANRARAVRNIILQSQTMVGGDHPLFTFNAVAFRSANPANPHKIIMGDGLLAAWDALGYSDVAPTSIFAHEFAHQLQFIKGYGIAGTPAEKTRFGELEADYMAAYYLTHARGGTMNRKRVEQFLQTSYQAGDCSFASSGHHGTPNQRLKAAQFGFDLADGAHKQGHIMTADEVHAAFLAVYPAIIAPDAR